jgi:hypothetical protein
MFRKALCIALVCAASPALAQEAWMSDVHDMGWIRVQSNRLTDWLLFIKDAPTPPGQANKRINVRFEWKEPQDTMLSASALYEVDCLEWRVRVVNHDDYTERNLQGAATNSSELSDWVHIAPNTVYGAIPERVCRRN